MPLQQIQNYVAGQWIDPESHGLLDVENPSTGEPIAQVPLSTSAEVDRAVAAARSAFPDWSATPVARRCGPRARATSRPGALGRSPVAGRRAAVPRQGRTAGMATPSLRLFFDPASSGPYLARFSRSSGRESRTDGGTR